MRAVRGIRTDSYSAKAVPHHPHTAPAPYPVLPRLPAHTGTLRHILRHRMGRIAHQLMRFVPHFATGSRSAVDQRRRRSVYPASGADGGESLQSKRHFLFTAILHAPLFLLAAVEFTTRLYCLPPRKG